MLKGVHLTLLVGRVVPAPVPQSVIDSLTSVKVTTNSTGRSGFQLSFTLGKQSPLQTMFMLSGGSAQLMQRVVIVATVNGIPEVLMDGVMTNHELTPSNDPGQSTLTVTGEDLSAVMDLIDLSGIPYPAMPDSVRVALILAKYAVFGVMPLVIPSVPIEVPNPLDEIPKQKGTDYAYVNSLAGAVGYVFYVSPGPRPGMSVAYWGPELKTGLGAPQPALSVNMDAHTNVESLSFSYDNNSKTLPVVFVHNKLTKVPIPIPIPDLDPLRPPLSGALPIPQKVQQMHDTAKLSIVEALLKGLSIASKTAEVVTASGSLSVTRYGRVLKARQLVAVRGAGVAFDGLYFVKSVTHDIKRGEYKQSFQLGRKGLVSTLPKVPV